MSLWKRISSRVLAIVSILFSNYYAPFDNAYHLQCLFLEKNIIIDDARRKITVSTLQLKSFKHNMLLFQAFHKKAGGPNKSEGGGGSRKFFRKKIDGGTLIRDHRVRLCFILEKLSTGNSGSRSS